MTIDYPGMVRARFSRDQYLLDKPGMGIVVLDEDTQVHFVDDIAAGLLAGSTTLSIKESRLSFTHPVHQARLASLLGDWSSAFIDHDWDSPSMRLEAGRASDDYLFFIVVRALDPTATNAAVDRRERRFALLIRERQLSSYSYRLGLAMRLRGPTEEAFAVADCLVKGDSLEMAAQRLNIPLETARVRLKGLYRCIGSPTDDLKSVIMHYDFDGFPDDYQ